MELPIEGISEADSIITRANFQYALIDCTVYSQDILGEKQVTDSQAGTIATDLLTTQYDASTEVLNQDTANAQSVSSDSNDFAEYNQIYQNDSATAQTGQNNASTAVDTIQTQISQDGSNISDLNSLTATIISVGGYVANLINNAYT